MKTLRILNLTIAVAFMYVGSAIATPLNTRPVTIGSSGEPSLQDVFDDLGLDLDAATDQSEAAIWEEAENDVSTYLINFFRGDNGVLGVYSYTNPSLTHEFSLNGLGKAGFDIDGGNFYADDGSGVVLNNFGNSFGFFWHDTSVTNYSYTEDDKNSDGKALALTYLLEDGQTANFGATSLNGYLLSSTLEASSGSKGANDWIIAFEDRVNGDNDFNDAIFWVEDLKPVPEPATMVLLGLGLIGLGTFGRKKGLFTKKA